MKNFSLPLIGTREFYVAGNTSPLVHVLGSPLVHVAGNNSTLVHVLRVRLFMLPETPVRLYTFFFTLTLYLLPTCLSSPS